MKIVTLLMMVLTLLFIGCDAVEEEETPAVFDVTTVTTAPTLDGNGSDAAWDAATDYLVTVGESLEYSKAYGVLDVTLTAVQTATDVYIKAVWDDPSATENDQRRLEFTTGTGWAKVGGEDRIFLMFDNGNGDEGADCATMCHTTEGQMWTTGGGEVDIWHWKASRTHPLGLADDKYFDAVIGDDGGRHGDAKTISAYKDNFGSDTSGNLIPLYSGPLTDGKHIIIAAGGSTADLTAYTAADTGLVLPRYYLQAGATASGEGRHQVAAKSSYANGVWTIEMKRALNTSDAHDVTFVAGSSVQMTLAITDEGGGDHSGAPPFDINF